MFDTAGIVERAAARRAANEARLAGASSPASKRQAEPGPVTTREKAVARMADDMRDIAGVSGSVDESALLNRGWSAQAVASFGPDARSLANRAAVRGSSGS